MDITQTLFRQRAKPRGDEAEAHIADLYGCDRATWYRRNGYPVAVIDQTTQAKFAIGLAYEAEVVQTLRAAGHDVKTGMSVDLLGLTGHPDAVIDDELLLEVKTTDARNPKPDVSPHYAVQAAAYAMALGLVDCAVLVKHAGSHAEVEYHFKAAKYAPTIVRRAKEVIERTAPGAEMPAAEPDELAPWGCSYCTWRQCERNPKHDAENAPL
jgi:hypothetical protein